MASKKTDNNVITVEPTKIEILDATTREWVETEVGQRTVVVDKFNHKDIRSQIEMYVGEDFSDKNILRVQTKDKNKTQTLHLQVPSHLENWMFPNHIQWDSEYLLRHGVDKPEVDALAIGFSATFSAKGEVVPEYRMQLLRYWCANGCYHPIVSRRQALNPNILVQKPEDVSPIEFITANMLGDGFKSQNKMLTSGEQLGKELLNNRNMLVTGKTNCKNALAKLIDMFDNEIIEHRQGEWGESKTQPKREMNSMKADAFQGWLGFTNNAFKKEFRNQLEMMHDNGTWGDHGISVLDLSNAFTNVVNYGDLGKRSKLGSRGSIEAQQQRLLEPITTMLMWQ